MTTQRYGRLTMACVVATLILLSITLPMLLADSSATLGFEPFVLNQTSELPDCSAIKDCEACYAATGCHFCENDRKCHRYGSLSGCIYGLSCEDQYKCLREKPEFHKYDTHSSLTYFAIIAGSLTLGALLIGVLYAGFFCCRSKRDEVEDVLEENVPVSSQNSSMNVGVINQPGGLLDDVPDSALAERRASPSAHTVAYHLLPDDGSAESKLEQHPGPQPAVEPQYIPEDQNAAQDANHDEMHLLPSKAFNRFIWCNWCRKDADSSELSNLHEPEPDQNLVVTEAHSVNATPSRNSNHCCVGRSCKCGRICIFRYVALTTAVLTCIGTILLCLFYPIVPDYSLCNTKFEWGSILAYVINMNEAAHVRLQLSIYNPNRFSVILNSMKCRVLYGLNSELVGYAEFPSMLTSRELYERTPPVAPLSSSTVALPHLSFDQFSSSSYEYHSPETTSTGFIASLFAAPADVSEPDSSQSPLKLPAGSITDITFVALVSPTLGTATNMGIDYARGQLFVNVHVIADTSIEIWDKSLTRVNGSYVVNDVNLATPPDRHLCACP